MAGPQIFAKIVVLGVGALQGVTGTALLAPGVGPLLSALIDLAFGELDDAHRKSLRTLCGLLADDLDRLLPGDAGTREAARLKAEELIARFGLSDREFADQDLDSAHAAEELLKHACFSTPSEATELRPGIKQILTCFYERLPARHELLASLLPHIHGATLRRLRRIEDEQRRQAEEQQRQTALLQQIAASMAASERVPSEVLLEILVRFGEAELVADRAFIEQRLRAKAEEYRDLETRLRRLSLEVHLRRMSNDGSDVHRLRRGAADLIAAGDFPGADALLAEAEALELAAVEELEQIARHRRISAAESRAERGAVARLALDYRAAAEHFAAAAAICASADPARQLDYLDREIEVLHRLGDEFGDTAALRLANARVRSLLARCPRERSASAWARAQIWLGLILHALGKREPDTARLEEAVAAYEDALLELTRERAPQQWAETQNNLGNALGTLGERERGITRLEKAVDAYNLALLEFTRERMPLRWAAIKNNLGLALTTIGERDSGTARLREAIDAHLDALEVRTRERVPLAWATTQNNLGYALTILGERQPGKLRLRKAVAAYREALRERTHERVPLDWALTQNNLGNALQILGDRELDPKRFEQAVIAYGEALKERTRERMPLDWAMTQNNLGNLLFRLGQLDTNTSRLEAAVDAYGNALLEFTRERVPLRWAATQSNLGNALTALGEREPGTVRLEMAVTAYHEALKEHTREGLPLEWAGTKSNLVRVLLALFERCRDIRLLDEAEAAVADAKQIYAVAPDQSERAAHVDSLSARVSELRANHLAGL